MRCYWVLCVCSNAVPEIFISLRDAVNQNSPAIWKSLDREIPGVGLQIAVDFLIGEEMFDHPEFLSTRQHSLLDVILIIISLARPGGGAGRLINHDQRAAIGKPSGSRRMTPERKSGILDFGTCANQSTANTISKSPVMESRA